MSPQLSTPPSLVGTFLASRYEIRALLGRGGMGEVYEAVDRQLDRTVALKVLRPELAADRRFLARFRREARTAARLAHPGIVAVHDVGEDGGRAFMVMEYVPGRTLGQIVSDEGSIAPARAALIAAAAADALAHAHERGVVHRDVSPGNVMVSPEGEVKVLDFGIARAARGSGLSGSPSAHGTLTYVAPEQARGEPTDQRADVYALGAVLRELTGGRPSLALDAVIQRCLAQDPARRWARADDLAGALREAAGAATDTRPMVASPATLQSAHTVPLAELVTAEIPVLDAPRRRRGGLGRAASAAAVAAVLIGGVWVLAPALASMGDRIPPKVHGPKPVPVPTGLAAATSCDGFLSTRAELSWTPGGPSRGYEIYRRQMGTEGAKLVARVDDWRTTSYVDPSLGVDTTYRYRIRAVSGPRVSAPSREVTAATPLFCLA